MRGTEVIIAQIEMKGLESLECLATFGIASGADTANLLFHILKKLQQPCKL